MTGNWITNLGIGVSAAVAGALGLSIVICVEMVEIAVAQVVDKERLANLVGILAARARPMTASRFVSMAGRETAVTDMASPRPRAMFSVATRSVAH